MKTRIMALIATAVAMAFLLGAQANAAFTVQNVAGTVEYRTSASGSWAKATNGLKLNQGATLRTQKGASCTLKSDAGNAVKVQALTSFDISAHSGGAAEKTQLNLNQGKIIASVKKGNAPGSSFNVKTPTAVAGVRGTDFFADVSDNGASSFGVTEGSIGVAAEEGGQETLVDQDFMVTVDVTGTINEPAPMPEEIKQEMVNETKELKTSTETTPPPAGQTQAPAGEKPSPAAEPAKEQPTTTTTTTTEQPAAPAEAPAPPAEPDTSAAADSAAENVNNALDNQVNTDTIDQATEAGMKTGTVNIDIYLGN